VGCSVSTVRAWRGVVGVVSRWFSCWVVRVRSGGDDRFFFWNRPEIAAIVRGMTPRYEDNTHS